MTYLSRSLPPLASQWPSRLHSWRQAPSSSAARSVRPSPATQGLCRLSTRRRLMRFASSCCDSSHLITGTEGRRRGGVAPLRASSLAPGQIALPPGLDIRSQRTDDPDGHRPGAHNRLGQDGHLATTERPAGALLILVSIQLASTIGRCETRAYARSAARDSPRPTAASNCPRNTRG